MNGYKVDWRDIAHFDDYVFECPCCDYNEMNLEFVDLLDTLCSRIKFSMHDITAGYRCPAYNEKVGGMPTSSHLKGLAVHIDIRTNGKRFDIIKEAMDLGITRIGVGKTFIHLDADKDKVQNVMWHCY